MQQFLMHRGAELILFVLLVWERFCFCNENGRGKYERERKMFSARWNSSCVCGAFRSLATQYLIKPEERDQEVWHASIHRAARCQSSFSSSPGSPACSHCLPSKGSRTGDRRLSSRKGSFTPEHGLAIPSHGAILPRLWARSRGLHSERCLSSITTDGGVCLKTSSGRASPSPGRRRCPAADSAVRPWSAVIIIKTRTPESPTRSVGFLSFFLSYLPFPPKVWK